MQAHPRFKQRKLAWFSDLHLEASYLSPSCRFAEGWRKTNSYLTPTWQSRKWDLHRLWDDEKSNKGKKSGTGRGQQQNGEGNYGNNEENGGKRRNPDGGSDLVANTITGYKNQ